MHQNSRILQKVPGIHLEIDKKTVAPPVSGALRVKKHKSSCAESAPTIRPEDSVCSAAVLPCCRDPGATAEPRVEQRKPVPLSRTSSR